MLFRSHKKELKFLGLPELGLGAELLRRVSLNVKRNTAKDTHCVSEKKKKSVNFSCERYWCDFKRGNAAGLCELNVCGLVAQCLAVNIKF